MTISKITISQIIERRWHGFCPVVGGEYKDSRVAAIANQIIGTIRRLKELDHQLIALSKAGPEPEFGIRLYMLGEIAVISDTTDENEIRYLVGCQDNGGMDWEEFIEMCENGPFRQICTINDLDAENACQVPYGACCTSRGDDMAHSALFMMECVELVSLMTNGVIQVKREVLK